MVKKEKKKKLKVALELSFDKLSKQTPKMLKLYSK